MGKLLTIAGGVLALVFAAIAVTQVHTVALAGGVLEGATGLFFSNSWVVFVIMSVGIAAILIVGAFLYAVSQK